MPDARHRSDQPLHPWLILQPPVWMPFAWWALLLGSVVASIAGDPGVTCSTATPCQPDAVFPMVVALVGIAALAFWWEPVAALFAGLGYGALSLFFDPSTPGRYAGLVVAGASVAGIAVLRSVRARQAQCADAAAVVDPSPAASAAVRFDRAQSHRWAAAAAPGVAIALAVAVAGVVLVAVSLLGYQSQTRGEQAHVDRAERTRAHVVTAMDDDVRQLVELDDGPRAGERVSIEVTTELAQGSATVVLLDPTDAAWSRLLSEPKGYTYWFGWAVVGGFLTGWAALQLLAARRTARRTERPMAHRVSVGRGRAELILAGAPHPVAWVPLLNGHHPASRRGASLRAVVRGPVADGCWVDIETDAGVLPVVGPVRAARRWRDVGVDVRAHPRIGALADRSRGVASAASQVLFVALGCFLLWFALGEVGPTWNAAHGRGVAGSFTVTAEECGGRGPCHHFGSFRSTDGRYSFADVELVGDSADVGQSVAALYEGVGEPPDSVFAPGWTGLVENVFYLAVAMSLLVAPARWLLEALALRRGPATGRHGQRRR